MSTPSGPRDGIVVECAVDCLVGIYPEERVTPQPVAVTLTLEMDLDACARTGELAASLDYAALAQGIEKILTEGRFRLLETAGLALLAFALAPRAGAGRATTARVSLCKTRALGGQARATVSLTRAARDMVVTDGLLFSGAGVTIVLRGRELSVTSAP